jgi:hypothetical protein
VTEGSIDRSSRTRTAAAAAATGGGGSEPHEARAAAINALSPAAAPPPPVHKRAAPYGAGTLPALFSNSSGGRSRSRRRRRLDRERRAMIAMGGLACHAICMIVPSLSLSSEVGPQLEAPKKGRVGQPAGSVSEEEGRSSRHWQPAEATVEPAQVPNVETRKWPGGAFWPFVGCRCLSSCHYTRN